MMHGLAIFMRRVVVPAACMLVGSAWALELGAPFADGMVLQRDRRVPIWGWAQAEAEVRVSFAGQELHTKADRGGAWRVDLAPMEACGQGRALSVNSGGVSAGIRDVLVGEVWYCSGQSNAEMPLVGGNPRFRDGEGRLVSQTLNRPLVRLCYACNYRDSEMPKAKAVFPVKWLPLKAKTLLGDYEFSALGVYYAMELHSALGVPVGIVGSWWGGTRIEPWIPAEGYASIGKDVSRGKAFKEFYEGQDACQWPSHIFNEMVNPFAPMAFRGMIWYQGCSNANDAPARYTQLMHALYNGWSKRFENPSMSFYYVQIAPWADGGHPLFQEAQARFADEQPNAAMAVVNDLGNLTDIHPNAKSPVARRLLVHALKRDYGFSDIEDNSPVLRSWTVEGDRVVMDFDHAGCLYLYEPKHSSLANGFELAGEDGVFKPCKLLNVRKPDLPTFDGSRIVISADGVSAPVRLRYLHSWPFRGTIYNEVNLPLSAFHLDDLNKRSEGTDLSGQPNRKDTK